MNNFFSKAIVFTPFAVYKMLIAKMYVGSNKSILYLFWRGVLFSCVILLNTAVFLYI